MEELLEQIGDDWFCLTCQELSKDEETGAEQICPICESTDVDTIRNLIEHRVEAALDYIYKNYGIDL